MPLSTANGLFLGADLSYVNEMEDCGAVFRARGKRVDPFAYMHARGGNIVRVRLWNNPGWTRYSTLADATRTMARAKAAGLQTLLDFHYSDDWADGDKQIAPAAWADLANEAQATALHDFTYRTLMALNAKGLMPDWVQVGNETNGELMAGRSDKPINWARNAALFNAGIAAVREAGREAGRAPRVMLHIAQPENVLGWFEAARAAGVTDFDLIGISYYRKWSKRSIAELGETIREARRRFSADVVVVETAYPFTNDGADASPNLLGEDTLIPGYPATPKGQLAYLKAITQTTVDNGGIGVIYWEPAWVSTGCKTRWGTGSNWENAAWFDLKRHEALPAFDFFSAKYVPKN
ncbi:MAG: arabinogalactan endo-beta-1,4-galactanase [Sphingomonas sp.]